METYRYADEEKELPPLPTLDVSEEMVKKETPLAPLLLQTDGYIVDYLHKILKRPIRVRRSIKQKMTSLGFIRAVVIGTPELPLYVVYSVIRPKPGTRRLIQMLRNHPSMTMNTALKKLRLFGGKTELTINIIPFDSWYRELFGNSRTKSVWQRIYTIVSPKGEDIARVVEIFSPKSETLARKIFRKRRRRARKTNQTRSKSKVRVRSRA